MKYERISEMNSKSLDLEFGIFLNFEKKSNKPEDELFFMLFRKEKIL